jgi:hypothetical protein
MQPGTRISASPLLFQYLLFQYPLSVIAGSPVDEPPGVSSIIWSVSIFARHAANCLSMLSQYSFTINTITPSKKNTARNARKQPETDGGSGLRRRPVREDPDKLLIHPAASFPMFFRVPAVSVNLLLYAALVHSPALRSHVSSVIKPG